MNTRKKKKKMKKKYISLLNYSKYTLYHIGYRRSQLRPLYLTKSRHLQPRNDTHGNGHPRVHARLLRLPPILHRLRLTHPQTLQNQSLPLLQNSHRWNARVRPRRENRPHIAQIKNSETQNDRSRNRQKQKLKNAQRNSIPQQEKLKVQIVRTKRQPHPTTQQR